MRHKAEEKELPEKTEAMPVEEFDPAAYGYSIPKNFEAQRKRVIDLKEQGQDGEKNISLILQLWKTKKLHEADGFAKFEDWAAQPNVTALAGPTIRYYIKLPTNWKLVADYIGVDLAMFKLIGIGHVAQLARAVASNAIPAARIKKELLPLADTTNKKYIPFDQFRIIVDKMLGVAAGETGEVLKTYILKPESGAAQEVIESCLQTLKGHPTYGDFSQSQILEKALVEFTANHAGDGGKTKFLTYQAAWNLLASLCPEGVAPINVVIDLGKAKEAGLGPVESKLIKSAFLGFPGYDSKMVLSTTKKRAASMIGVDEKQVREYLLEIDPGLLPKMLSKHWEKTPNQEPTKSDELVEADEPPPPLMPIAEFLKLDKDDLLEYAASRGIKFTKRAKRESMMKTLLTDPDWYGLKDDEADAKIRGELEENIEEAPSEPTEQTPAAETKEAKSTSVIDVQAAEKLVRANLEILREHKAIDRETFAETYNALPKNLSEAEKHIKLLEWTRKIGAEKGIKVE